MEQQSLLRQKPRIVPPLEPGFLPVSLGDMCFQAAAESGIRVGIAYERENNLVERGDTWVLPESHPNAWENPEYLIDRINSGIVHNGCHTVWLNCPEDLGRIIQKEFSISGSRKWVVDDLSATSYDRPFEVKLVSFGDMPSRNEATAALGSGMKGYRIGFDLGASDFKVTAFIDGVCVYSEEIPWNPSEFTDPNQHYEALLAGLNKAREKLGGRVDSIGGSSAGVWVNNRLKIGSIAKGIVGKLSGAEKLAKMEHFNRCLVDDINAYFGVNQVIINDGNVTALAGQQAIPGSQGIIGIALGSDEAGGYAHPGGIIDTKLYEWAFRRVDRAPDAPVYPWANLQGVGGMYFSQKGWDRLYSAAGISLDEIGGADASIAERLKGLQSLVEADDPRAILIPQTLGIELGYSIMPYVDDCRQVSHILVLGRCMRGKSGKIMREHADNVIFTEFHKGYNFQLVNPEADSFKDMVGPEAAEKFTVLGQAAAAATLPPVNYK